LNTPSHPDFVDGLTENHLLQKIFAEDLLRRPSTLEFEQMPTRQDAICGPDATYPIPQLLTGDMSSLRSVTRGLRGFAQTVPLGGEAILPALRAELFDRSRADRIGIFPNREAWIRCPRRVPLTRRSQEARCAECIQKERVRSRC